MINFIRAMRGFMPEDRPSFAAFLTMLCGVLLIYGTLSQFGRQGLKFPLASPAVSESSELTKKRVSAEDAEKLSRREIALIRIGAVPLSPTMPTRPLEFPLGDHYAMQPSADRVVHSNHVQLPAEFSPAPLAATVPNAQPQSQRQYQVQSGDTLYKIAKKFYGNGEQWRKIERANDLRKNHNLMVGQRLVVPE